MESANNIRIAVFLAILLGMAAWEIFAPGRTRVQSKLKRWLGNISLVALDTLIVRLLLPAGAAGVALWCAAHHVGLLYLLQLPEWLTILIAVILLDLAIYVQHVVFHAVPLLWRLHMVHHADRDLDVSSGLRFHPLEILLSMLIKMGLIALLGAPLMAVIIFETILNGMAMFNHANIRLPLGIDRALRLLLVTPDMHRVHHSVIVRETNSNYGFNLSLWDRLFGTYR
ncbi:MAG: sterol desaturase family protein, partial [Mariprofundaceae bacterium]